MLDFYSKKLANSLSLKRAISSLPIIIAIILLASTPILMLQIDQEVANKIAGYSFYLLAGGILLRIIQRIVEKQFRTDSLPAKIWD